MIIAEKEAIAVIGLLKFNHKRNDIISKPKNTFQIQLLSRIFNLNKFPSEDVKQDLSIILSLSYKSIQIWFQNKRQRSKIEQKIDVRAERSVYISHNKLVSIAYEVYVTILSENFIDFPKI